MHALVIDGQATPGRTPLPAEQVTLAEADENSLGVVGMDWLESWWDEAVHVEAPKLPARAERSHAALA